MRIVKPNFRNYFEILFLLVLYLLICINCFVYKDNPISCFSAFFGITYTFWAGKGYPLCYLFGVLGSGLYGWLSLTNSLWGNLILYVCYYIPMQITGYFKWSQNLKANSSQIIKTKLSPKEAKIIVIGSILLSIIAIAILYILNDNSPLIDGITTILSITGMYLTVKRYIEQWYAWMIVNGLSAIMWIGIALKGEKVYSTVLMWCVYFVLAVYFYIEWKKEIKQGV